MTSTALRPAIAAVILTLVLALCAVPAGAQPFGPAPRPEQAQRDLLPQLWSWLTALWPRDGTPDRTQQNSSDRTSPAGTDGIAPGGLFVDRGGTMDPNG